MSYMNSKDNLKKRKVSYVSGQPFFTDREGPVLFRKITAFYVKSIQHSSGGVVLGHEYLIQLELEDRAGYYTLNATSDRPESYKTLCRIHNAIADHMKERLTRAMKSGDAVLFPTLSDTVVTLRHKRITVTRTHTSKPPLRTPGEVEEDREEITRTETFTVEALVYDEESNCLEMTGQGQTVTLPIHILSNADMFFALAEPLLPIKEKEETPLKPWMRWALMVFVGVFGLNGWTEFYMDSFWVEIASVYCSMLVLLGVIFLPFRITWDEPWKRYAGWTCLSVMAVLGIMSWFDLLKEPSWLDTLGDGSVLLLWMWGMFYGVYHLGAVVSVKIIKKTQAMRSLK